MTRRLISSGSTFEHDIGYSRAVVDDEWVFVSGTTGFDYRAMTLADGVVEQAEQCLKNIEAALAEAGATMADVVRVNYILPDATAFASCWPVLRRYFGDVRPAATMISAALADPRMKIEIEVTARMKRRPAVTVAREFWRLMASNDFDSVAAVLAPSFVLEWPQSKERIRGAEHFARMSREYVAHGAWQFTIRTLLGQGDAAVSEVEITDGVQRATAISFFSVEEGKIVRLVEYWPEPFAARADRAHLVEIMR